MEYIHLDQNNHVLSQVSVRQSTSKLLSVIISFTITALGVSDRIFRSPSFKNSFCSFILHFSGLIMIRFFLDPALNLYFDLTIRGTDTVCID